MLVLFDSLGRRGIFKMPVQCVTMYNHACMGGDVCDVWYVIVCVLEAFQRTTDDLCTQPSFSLRKHLLVCLSGCGHGPTRCLGGCGFGPTRCLGGCGHGPTRCLGGCGHGPTRCLGGCGHGPRLKQQWSNPK